MTARKKLAFSLIPLAFLIAIVEGGLGLAGVRPSSETDDPYVHFAEQSPLFVLTADENGDRFWRTAAPKRTLFNDQRFAAEKPPGVRRIFCLGGSTTYGRPYRDAMSFCGWLRESLQLLAPETRWEIVNAGGISYASYRVAAVMRELARHEPDLFIVYTGHNEFLEERTLRALRERPAALRWLDSRLRATRSHAAVAALLGRPAERATGGRDQLAAEVKTRLDSSVGPASYHRDDALRDAIVEHYRLNLEQMIDIARSAGAKITLVVPADNLRDSSPFKSEMSTGRTDSERAQFGVQLATAEQAFQSGQIADARAGFAAAVNLDPRHAGARYGLGRALAAAGENAAAESELTQARNEDVCPLRALTSMTEIVRAVAAAHDVALIDFPALLRSASPPGAPPRGADWFLDHVHPTIAGHQLLARSLLTEVARLGWLPVDPQIAAPRIAAMEERVRAGLDPREHGIALRNLGKVLSWAGKSEDAARVARQALAVLGEDAESYFILSIEASERGAHNRAVAYLREAVRLDPEWVKARHNLGVELARIGRYDDALAAYDEVLQRAPAHGSVRFNRANALRKLGRLKEAIDAYRDSLRQDPRDGDASFNLARAYLRDSQPERARGELRRLLETSGRDTAARREAEDLLIEIEAEIEREGSSPQSVAMKVSRR